jgi:hypothetical protein
MVDEAWRSRKRHALSHDCSLPDPADPVGRENLAAPQTKRFILREERNFVQVVDGTFELPATFTEP